MALTSGTRLGTYEITALIGAGGMGEVYRARDSRLNRDVALKVLPELFAADPDRLARFKREAQVLASLNHPNIAAIYGFEEGGGVQALVLELVEGPTLADRIAQGPIPLDEALPIARQIAEALEAAHEHGIIHRDLKPANIKVRPDGTVKVLDFGLAKAFEGDPASSAALSMSPTITSPAATRMGMILGTAAYMSPEQARGKAVDKRSDIWSFGCVLYEMLTGKSAFAAEDVSLTLSQILQRDADWSALPAGLSATARSALISCLQKDPRQRLRDFGDVRLMLATEDDTASSAPRRTTRPYNWLAAGALAGLAAGGVLVWALAGPNSAPAQPTRFAIAAPPGIQLGRYGFPDLALSPDGRTMVFAAGAQGVAQLYRRDMESLEISAIRGTEGAMQPFFSPDGQSIGFFTDRTLSKVALDGGLPTPVSDITGIPAGGTWAADDTIFFALQTSPGLFRVAAGGASRESIRLDTGSDATYYSSPHALPGGRTIAAAAQEPDAPETGLVVISLDRGDTVSLGPGASPKYAATGHLLYWRGNAIWGVAFDPAQSRPRGAAAALVAGVELAEGIAPFALAGDGTLVYAKGTRETDLTWIDASGVTTRALRDSGPYVDPSLSPDGRNVALAKQESNQDIWLYDLLRDTATKLTSQPGLDMAPIWDATGKQVTYTEQSGGSFSLVTIPMGGAGATERLLAGPNLKFPSSWSPDGHWLAYVERDPQTSWDIWLLDNERRPQPFERTPFQETDPVFSPDGRLIAYTSDESGQREVYVDSFPQRGAKRSISRAGGIWPVWSRAGDRLFYQTPSHVVAVPIGRDGEFGPPQPLFPSSVVGGFVRPYDVAPDGRRLLVLNQKSEAHFEVVLHWFEELRRLVPAN